MATKPATIGFLVEQLGGDGVISARKMFGEYALYLGGKLVALVCDEQLFMKPTSAGRAHVGEAVEAPPYKGAKPWLLIGGEAWDDGDWMSTLARVTAAELPMPVKKAKARSR